MVSVNSNSWEWNVASFPFSKRFQILVCVTVTISLIWAGTHDHNNINLILCILFDFQTFLRCHWNISVTDYLWTTYVVNNYQKLNTYGTLLYNFVMHWSLWGVLPLGQAKPVDCNKMLGQFADQNCKVKFNMKAATFHTSEKILYHRQCPHILKMFCS